MPEHMLRYRSATFLIRLYCSEVMIGVPMQAEHEMPTLRDVSPDGAPVVEASKDAPIEGTAAPAEAEPPKKTRHEIQKEYQAEQRRKADEQRAAARAAEAKKPAGPSESQMRGMLDLIRAELRQGASVEAVGTTYAAQIAVMQQAFPALFAEVQALLSPQGPGERDGDAGDLFDEAPDFMSTPVARQFLADVEAVGLQEARDLHEAQLDALRRTSGEAYRALIRKAEDMEAS